MLQVWQQPSNLPLPTAAKAHGGAKSHNKAATHAYKQRFPHRLTQPFFPECLLGYNSRIAYRLIKGFSEGFKINYQGPRITSTAPNLGSAYENPDVVDEKLGKERALGRIAGPFDSPPLAKLRISPLGVIPKKTPGAF